MAKDVYSDLNFVGGAKPTGLPAGSAPGHAVEYAQWNAAKEGLAWKDDVVAASTANINLSSPGATIDGVTMVSGDRFLAKDQTTGHQNGVYVWNGSAVAATRADDMSASAEFNAAVVPVKAGGSTNGGTTWRCTTADPTVGTTTVTFAAFATTAPAASETVAGLTEEATQAEVDGNTGGARFVSSDKLNAWSGRIRRMTGNIGDGSSTQIDITHNFGSRAVQVEVWRNSTPWDTVLCDVSRPDTNTVRFNFVTAPGTNALSYVIHY